MRTLMIGLLGGVIIFSFFWYRGDIGSIPLGPLGELRPPTERPFLDRLSELQAEARAVHGDLAPDVETTSFRTPQFYAGQLIAKPRRVEQPANEIASVFALTTASAVDSGARAIAEELGDVETGFGETMLINLEFDLDAPEAPPNIPEAGPGQVQPLSFRPMARIRAMAARTDPRTVTDRREGCESDRDDLENDVECAVERLRASGRFEYVEKNLIVTHEMEPAPQVVVAAPTDPLYAFQWHYRSQGEAVGQSVGGAGFVDFWTQQRQLGSRDVVVAVVDTGLDTEHPDILASGNLGPGVDMVSVPFYGNDGDGRDLDPSDPGDICDTSDPSAQDTFHGTHVAGTIGAVATDNGDGVAGGAWNVTIVPVRALGRCGGLQSDINDAIRWAAGVEPAIVETDDGGAILFENPNPADIINLSLGFRAPDGCPRSTQDAINDAVNAGAIVVAAAGNAGVDVAGYGPAGCENVVTVAAGDAVGALSHYSNWGVGVDVMAPGGDMRRDLDGDGNPDGVLSTKRVRDCRDPLTNERIDTCIYAFEQGTSMAAPHVSAAFALLKSEFPDATNSELVATVLDRARAPREANQCTGPCDLTPGGEPVAGTANLCFRPCGSGLLDLGRAVTGQGGPFADER